MSWKLFWQIVLLIVFAAVILIVTKSSMRCLYRTKYKMMKPAMSQSSMEGMGNRGMMMKGKGMTKGGPCK